MLVFSILNVTRAVDIHVPQVSEEISSLDNVECAGAAPTDKGGFICFHVVVNDYGALNDSTEEIIRQTIARNSEDMEVATSKGDDTVEMPPSIWAIVYHKIGEIERGNSVYDIAKSNSFGVYAIDPDFAGLPGEGVLHFSWEEIEHKKNSLTR